MAYVTIRPIARITAAKFVDKNEGWPVPTGQMISETDGKAMSVTMVNPTPANPEGVEVNWVDPSNYTDKERFIYRKDKVDVFPDGFKKDGAAFGIGEP